jgi:hypothetical protein
VATQTLSRGDIAHRGPESMWNLAVGGCVPWFEVIQAEDPPGVRQAYVLPRGNFLSELGSLASGGFVYTCFFGFTWPASVSCIFEGHLSKP